MLANKVLFREKMFSEPDTGAYTNHKIFNTDTCLIADTRSIFRRAIKYIRPGVTIPLFKY